MQVKERGFGDSKHDFRTQGQIHQHHDPFLQQKNVLWRTLVRRNLSGISAFQFCSLPSKRCTVHKRISKSSDAGEIISHNAVMEMIHTLSGLRFYPSPYTLPT